MKEQFTHLGLFEGIGGFSLAARWMGWETLAWCEWNEFGQKVLRHHFPNAEGFGDITKTDFTKYANRIDILTGGFPCQPYSVAGKRKGKDDARHLWPEMLRAIGEIQPTYVVGENVGGIVSWNGGLVFHEVQTDLEAQGYEIQPFILPACSRNAPHKRDRVWFIAYNAANCNSTRLQKERAEQQATRIEQYGELDRTAKNTNSNGWDNNKRKEESSIWQLGSLSTRDNEQLPSNNAEIEITTNSDSSGNNTTKRTENGIWEQQNKEQQWSGGAMQVNGLSDEQFTTDTESERLQGRDSELTGNINQSTKNNIEGTQIWGHPARHNKKSYWDNFPTKPPVCGGDDGIPRELDTITFPKWRNESIKAYGNAIVPQIAFEIFKAIEDVHKKF